MVDLCIHIDLCAHNLSTTMSSAPRPSRRSRSSFSGKTNFVENASSRSTSPDVDATIATTSSRSNSASSASARNATLAAAIATTSSPSYPASNAATRNAALATRDSAFLQKLVERLPLRAGQIAMLLDFVKKGYLVRVAKAVMAFIKAHRWEIFWSLATIVGIVLIINPLAVIGFGAMGPIAGSIAAGWQAAIGNVAAGSLFAFLQSVGMVHFVTIPLVGVAVAGGGAVALAKVTGVLQPASRWVQKTATSAWQWLTTRRS
ncbi:hypothetical protein DFH09DRAFT_1368526 [Mycena vulgaris]|nr:hypothetical protein DFH09DRAFT_1368526 [Mycena vulgaris]